MKRAYTVDVQTAPLERVDEATLEAFSSALFADQQLRGPAPAANLLTRTLAVRTSVDATSPEEAFATAIARVRLALRRAGVGNDVEIADAAVMLELPEDEFASARDDVVGTPDVAERLGISRQRVAQLVEQVGRFPHPIATVRGTHVWRWGDIADWIAAGARDMRRKAAKPDSTIDLMQALQKSVARDQKAAKHIGRPRRKAS